MEGTISAGSNVQKDVKPISRLLAMKKRLHQQRNGRPKVSVESDSKLTGEMSKEKECESKQTQVRYCESETKLKAKEIYKYKLNGSLPQNGSANPLGKIPKSHPCESDLDRGTTSRKSKISRIFKSRSVEMKLGTENKVGTGKRTPRSKTTEVHIEDLPAGGATVPKMNGCGTFTKLVNANSRTQASDAKHPNGVVHIPKNVPNTKSGDSSDCLKLPTKHIPKPANQGSFRRRDNRSQTMTKAPGKIDSRPCIESKQEMRTYSRVLITGGGTVPEEQFRKRTSSDGYAVNYVKREISTNKLSTIVRSTTSDTDVNRPQKRSEDLLQDSAVSDEGGFRPRPSKKITARDVDTVENEKHSQNASPQRAPLKLIQALEGWDHQPDRPRSNNVALATGQRPQPRQKATRPTELKLPSTSAVATGNARMAGPQRCMVSVGGMDLELGPGNQHKTPEQWEGRKPRYPRHTGTGKRQPPSIHDHPAEHLRRKVTAGSGRPDATYDLDDVMSTMSEADANDAELFNRGNRLRSSLPIVRSPNKSLDKALGLVYLNIRNETKRALLPNEVTSMDTVRALFVRSFPECLSMRWFEEHPHCRIYVRAAGTDLFYQLEDLRDVRDRSILKIHEPAPTLPIDSPTSSPSRDLRLKALQQGYESDSSACSAPPSVGFHSPRCYQGPSKMAGRSEPDRTKTLPTQNMHKQSYTGQSPSPSPSPSPATWSPRQQQPPYLAGVHSNQGSPHRATTLPANQGASTTHHQSLAYLVDANTCPPDGRLPQSRSYHDYHVEEKPGRNTSPQARPEQNRRRMDKMEAQLANLTAWVHTAVIKGGGSDGSRPGSARSNSSISESSYSTKSKGGSTTPTPIQSPLGDLGCQGMTDFSADSRPLMTNIRMQPSLSELQHQAVELRSEVNQLRQMQLANMAVMKDTIQNTFLKIKVAVRTVPGANDQPVRQQRQMVDKQIKSYSELTRKVEDDLRDLEASVEGVKNDVLSKKCRANMSDVESMALALSSVSKTLADLKTKFPALHDMMKKVMSSEMEIVVKEEKFIKDEPEKVEKALKKLKKLTSTLYTLKRLALVQEMQPLNVPNLNTKTSAAGDEDRKAVLESIQAMIPNHQARLESLQSAAESRERLKKMTNSTETLRFEKSLELAQRQLRETKYAVENEQRAEEALSDLYGKRGVKKEIAPGSKVIPLNSARQNNLRDGERSRDLPSPPKPPRSSPLFSHVSPTSGLSGSMTTGSGGMTTSANGRSLQHSPCFLTSSVMSSPSKTSMQSANLSPILGSPNKPPIPPPVGASMSGKGHVTFCSAVTEIRSPTRDHARKVAPPPPPRKSSRVAAYVSPRHSPVVQHHPLYENVEKMSKWEVNTKKVTDRRMTVEPPQSPQMSVSSSAAGPRVCSSPTKQIILMSPPKPRRPLTKFQQDLAAGIFSDINRPDLQEQKLNAAEVVRNAENSSAELSTSDSESSTSADSQVGVAALRQRLKMVSTNGTILEEVSSPNGTKRLPPPPPERKASTLMGNTHNAQGGMANGGSGTMAEWETQQGANDNQLMGVIVKTITKYGETEIY